MRGGGGGGGGGSGGGVLFGAGRQKVWRVGGAGDKSAKRERKNSSQTQ